MPKGKSATSSLTTPSSSLTALKIQNTKSSLATKGYTESSISLAEISVRVVEYAEQLVSKHTENKILDPQKCYVKIAELIGLGSSRRNSTVTTVTPQKSKSTSPKKAPSKASSRVSSPTSISQMDTNSHGLYKNTEPSSVKANKDRRSKENIVKRRVFDVLHILENTGLCKRVSPNRAAGYYWYGLKSLAKGLKMWQGVSRAYCAVHEKSLRHLKVPILSTICYMFLRVCMNTNDKTTTLKEAAGKIFKELLLKLKDTNDSKLPTQKGVERRLYDVVSVLATVGVINRTRKCIGIPSEILKQNACDAHARQAMLKTKQNPQKRRKPRTSEEVALDKFLKALNKSKTSAYKGSNSSKNKTLKNSTISRKGKRKKSTKSSNGEMKTDKAIKESESVTTVIGASISSSKRSIEVATPEHIQSREERIATLSSAPKRRKMSKKKNYNEIKKTLQHKLGNISIGTNVILAYDQAEEIGVELDDVKLFVTALAAVH
jgi:hypothetical protein